MRGRLKKWPSQMKVSSIKLVWVFDEAKVKGFL
jgi:hypothetical protein